MSFGFNVGNIIALSDLIRQIQRDLLELRIHIDPIRIFYDQVDSDEEWTKKQELLPLLVPERIIREQLLRSLEHLALLLLKVLRFLLSYIRSAGFMNRRRPKCTTMPWEIWPSLVVLWGVCWMFYPPTFYQNGNQRQPPLEDEQLPYFSHGMQSL
jgi:hypothetical protein